MRGPRLGATFLCALPWLRSLPGLPSALGRMLDDAFLPLCHHLPGRVLALGGAPMCVCSRCAGLYAGLAMGFLLGGPPRDPKTHRRWVLAALVATLLDVATQDAGVHPPYHPVRLATGALLGWTVAVWMVDELRPGLDVEPGRPFRLQRS